MPSERETLKPYVFIDPYQYEGDCIFGRLVEGDPVFDTRMYELDDGDWYRPEDLERTWHPIYLTCDELAALIKLGRSALAAVEGGE